MHNPRVQLAEPAVAHYLRFVNRHGPLDPRSQRKLLREARNGDGDALDHVFKATRPLMVELARQQYAGGLEFMDLVAEGSVALIMAIREYDEESHGPFDIHVIRRVRLALETAEAEAERRAS
ncbi:MAG: sigma factor [Candidatus Krumholzibacteriia bacterium]